MAVQPDILLVAALRPEYEALEEARLNFPAPLGIAEFGIGRRGVEKRLRPLLSERRPELLILFGTSAWIREDKNYFPGQTFLVERAVYSPRRIEERAGITYYPTWEEQSALAVRLAGECGVAHNRVFTLDTPLRDDNRRQLVLTIIEKYHDAHIDLVDMESWHVLNLAQKLKIPALVLRVLTDFAGGDSEAQFARNLPRALECGVRELAQVLGAIDRHPEQYLAVGGQ